MMYYLQGVDSKLSCYFPSNGEIEKNSCFGKKGVVAFMDAFKCKTYKCACEYKNIKFWETGSHTQYICMHIHVHIYIWWYAYMSMFAWIYVGK